MQGLLEAVNRHAAAVGMCINGSKTKLMSALTPWWTAPSCLGECGQIQVPWLDVRRKRPGHREDQRQDESCPFRILSSATLSLVAAWNIVAYKGQGLPGSSALNFTRRLRDMTCTSSGRRDVGSLRQWQHPPHSTRKAQRLCAIRGAASPPLPYTHTSTARAKKAPLVWSCHKMYRRWVDQGPSRSLTTSHVAQASWLLAEDVGIHAWWRKDCVKVSSELTQDRRTWSASIQDVVNSICDLVSNFALRWWSFRMDVNFHQHFY